MGSQMVRFFSIVFVLLIYTAYKASQLWPTHQALATTLTLPLFALMLGGTFVYRSEPEVFEAPWFRLLAWAGCLVMGLWGTFILLSLPFDLLHLVMSGFSRVSKAATAAPGKEIFSFRFLSLTLLVLSGGMVAMGFIEVLRGPRIKEVSAPVKNLDPSLQGLKIVQISDLHIGPTIRKGYVETIVSRVNAVHPDLIFITGDIADAKASSILEHLEPLIRLQASFGVFYVTGNHEYYWGAAELIEKVQALGVISLVNENRVIQVGEAQVLVAGVTDPMGEKILAGHRPDLKKAVKTTEDVQFKILLAHRPDACFEAERLGFDLQFSGHTHAGQFFPFSLLIGFAHKYYRGLNRHGRLWVYVNPGTGYWGPANRLGVSPEITLLKLAIG